LIRPCAIHALQQVHTADDACQQIVDVVGDTVGQLPNRLLRLAELLFGSAQSCRLLLLGGEVTRVGADELALARVCQKIQRASPFLWR
jgi:hypothetical protein